MTSQPRLARIYKNAWFEKFARKEKIEDATLVEAIRNAEKGLIDADLGGGVIKQRVARPGAGKSGGYRTIIFYKAQDRAVFVYGFAKNDRANLEPDELKEYRLAAGLVLGLTEAQIAAQVEAGKWVKVTCDDEDL
ncbi:MAG TPA: type II toxin-antitoxin system RelE/ParE family toxin [Asticcacaulis sp.]|nr:type II toxin-antitoxin system RelE/ParE family toxin [Asticcacaulis sp.]